MFFALFALVSLATLAVAADQYVYIPLSAEVAIGSRKGLTDSLFWPPRLQGQSRGHDHGQIIGRTRRGT